MSSAGDRQHSSRKSPAPDRSQVIYTHTCVYVCICIKFILSILFDRQLCEDVKTETSDGGTSETSEVCVKKETLELNVYNHEDDLESPAEVLSIKEEDPDCKDSLCKTPGHSGAQ